jgi:hypothetical protein
MDFTQQVAARTNPSNWSITSNNGTNVEAVNTKTGETFSGTTANFNAIFTAGAAAGAALPEQAFLKTSIPVMLPSNIVIATNGSFTCASLPATYTAGAWLYLPASAVVTPGTAGLYFATFSGPTAGQLYTNYVDPAVTDFTPYIPVAPVANTSTGVTATIPATETTLMKMTVPANALGLTGSVDVDIVGESTNNATAKTIVAKFGGTAFATATLTSLATARAEGVVINRGAANANSFVSKTSAASTSTVSQQAINTAAAVSVIITGTRGATGTDFVIVTYARMEAT